MHNEQDTNLILSKNMRIWHEILSCLRDFLKFWNVFLELYFISF